MHTEVYILYIRISSEHNHKFFNNLNVDYIIFVKHLQQVLITKTVLRDCLHN